MTRAEQMAAADSVLFWCADCGKAIELNARVVRPGVTAWQWIYDHRAYQRIGNEWGSNCYPEEIDMARRA